MLDIENNTGKIQTIDNSKFFRILKSNFLLMLYNLVEACVVSGMLEIYESLKQSQSGYNELIEEIQSLWSKYKIGEIYKSSGTRSSYEKGVREIIAQVITDEPVFLNRAALEISGNLDARRIKNLCDKHCIRYVASDDDGCLKTVKEKRQNLAHGDESFGDCARDMTLSQLEHIKDEVIRFIGSILNGMKNYYDKIVILLERFMKFISNSSDVYFRRITFTDGVRPAAFFYCKSVSEKSSGGMDVFYHDFNVMKYVPKIIENLAKELGNRITESVTLGHIENYESMFTPQRFIEQIMAFEYLFEKLEPEKAEQRNFHLIDELELMLGVFPDVIAGVRKSTRKIADEIKNLRVDIVHGHAYYYDFANDHNIQYYMLMLDKLIERMNLKLVGFNDEEIKTFCSY